MIPVPENMPAAPSPATALYQPLISLYIVSQMMYDILQLSKL